MKQTKLFSNSNATDPLYADIKDHNPEIRGHLEEIWDEYREHADQNFDIQLSNDFLSRVWEMSLFKILRDANIEIEKKIQQKGPDIIIRTGTTTINIEAIAAGPGDPDSPDSVVRGGKLSTPDESFYDGDISSQSIELRITNALKKKTEKFQAYANEHVIHEDDVNIIAISVAKIPVACVGFDLGLGPVSHELKSLWPVGNAFVTGGSPRRIGHEYKAANIKTNGEPVLKTAFSDISYQQISAVIYTTDQYPGLKHADDRNVFLIRNPYCRKPLVDSIGISKEASVH